jgi:UDP-2,4-diacetamido-2,4,6-trideoxy-beta-L-altropyranose hydrolase
MRCFALAQAWRGSGGTAIFVSAEITPALEARLARDGFETARISATPGTKQDAAKSQEIARARNASWMVADGYNFGPAYQRDIQAAGLRLLLLDDYGHAGEYSADLVLNQNLGASADLYAQREPHTRLLLGPRYALLREEFLRWHDWERKIPAVARKVLVTLGGSDPDNVTSCVVDALRHRTDVEMRIVVGGSAPHFDPLSSSVRPPSAVIRDATNMSELMAWADMAVTAAGTTSWELAFMGLPSLMLVLAENQRGVAAALENANFARTTNPEQVAEDLNDLLSDEELRTKFSKEGRRLVDGQGTRRVVTYLSAASLELHRARPEDCQLIWEWANEPEARAVSLSTEPIPWEVHQKWFASRVSSPLCLFYIATNGPEAQLGQIRYDIKDDTAVVSLSLAREARGRGLGPALIWRGSERCFADSSVKLIRAYVKPDNQASIRAFCKAGFSDAGSVEMSGTTVRQFVMSRECIL